MATPGKESKEKKSGKDEASTYALRKITEELTALRADIDAMKLRPDENAPATVTRGQPHATEPTRNVTNQSVRLQKLLSEPTDAAVSMAYAYRLADGDGHSIAVGDELTYFGLENIVSVDDAKIARLGYALSSAPKVAILRILLTSGPQSASQIGDKAALTTGSLYHHLRELTHAAVIESTVRNRFELTEIGRQTALLVFTQAGRLASAG